MHANMMWKHELAESIKILEWALERNFAGETLELNGWSMPVDDVLEILRSYVYQIARTEAVHEQWLREATAERDEFRGEISPLLAKLRMYIAATYGPSSPRMRDFGFKPVTTQEDAEITRAILDRARDEGDDEVPEDDDEVPEDDDEDTADERG
jgi:hypothetical protein